jgi:hypothetical protein
VPSTTSDQAYPVFSLEDKAKDKEDPYQVPMDVLQMITKDFEPIQQQQQPEQIHQEPQRLQQAQELQHPPSSNEGGKRPDVAVPQRPTAESPLTKADEVVDKVLQAVRSEKSAAAAIPRNAVAKVTVDADAARGKTRVSVVPLARPDAKEVFEVDTCDVKRATEMLRPLLKERFDLFVSLFLK